LDGLALLIVDMMNDHIHSDGVSARYFKSVPPEQRPLILENTRRVLVAARAAGLPVVHVRGELRWDSLDGASAPARLRTRPKHPPNVPFKIAGTWGAQLVDELAPLPEEIVVIKKGHSGFGFTNLDPIARRLGIQTFLTTGGAASGCIADTVREGAGYGYEFLIVRDGIYNLDHPVLRSMGTYAELTTTEEAVGLLAGARTPPSSAR
jgi:ureidoacrylate peracid hydrolase